MKKVLLLGGSKYIIPVIEACHKLGYKAITCDYLPDNIAHKYSDEYYNVSIIDKDAVLELAKELEVDGILSFACDPGVETMAYVCEKLGLPCVGSYKSVLTLQDKTLFRQFLKDNGFNWYTVSANCKTDSDIDTAYLDGQIIVKDSKGKIIDADFWNAENLPDSIKADGKFKVWEDYFDLPTFPKSAEVYMYYKWE